MVFSRNHVRILNKSNFPRTAILQSYLNQHKTIAGIVLLIICEMSRFKLANWVPQVFGKRQKNSYVDQPTLLCSSILAILGHNNIIIKNKNEQQFQLTDREDNEKSLPISPILSSSPCNDKVWNDSGTETELK